MYIEGNKETAMRFYCVRITKPDGHWIDYCADHQNAKEARKATIKTAGQKDGIEHGTAQIMSINATVFNRGKVVTF